MKLYHGTNYSSAINIVENGIDLSYSKPYLDFGAGFYTTPSYRHAAITAVRTTDKYNARHKIKEGPYVVELSYIPKKDLAIRLYPHHSKAWGEFVLSNRLSKDLIEKYDITEHNQDLRYDVCCGEIADGKIVNIAYLLNQGLLDFKGIDFSQFIKDNGGVYPQQYSFHTEKALSCIFDLECDMIRNKETYHKVVGRR